MRRIISLVLISVTGLSAAGCGTTLEWLRGAGHYPGIAPSDYAFYDYCGTASQVFQFTVPQVQSSAIEALRDMGFRDLGPAKPCCGEGIAIKACTPDGRPATITFTPQNAMTNMRIVIGPVHLGDQMLTRDVFRRVALNFGTLPRDYLPMEPTLARRTNPVFTMPPPQGAEPPQVLEGEGLRAAAERKAPELEFTAPVTGTDSGAIPPPFDPYRPYIPTIGYPNPPYMPYAPWPYTPFTPGGAAPY